MQAYASKDDFIKEINRTADLFVKEFEGIAEENKDTRLEEDGRTPFENLAYQLGWMALIRQWDEDEGNGKEVQMPAPGIKWNQMGLLHQKFYAAYGAYSLEELKSMFIAAVQTTCHWLQSLDEQVLFQPGGRKWAGSTPANWPVWKWVHINTVAPFKSFRTSLRKWKKLYAVR